MIAPVEGSSLHTMHRIADALERIAAALEVPQMCELPEQTQVGYVEHKK